MDRWSDVFEEWASLSNFMAFLSGSDIGFSKTMCGHEYPLGTEEMRKLFCEFHDIDQKKKEQERRALLETARNE